MQIFADPECTQYATGEVDTVYARVNVPWGFGETWDVGDYSDARTCMMASAPGEGAPDDPYSIKLWIDYSSADYQAPFEAGQIVPIAITDGWDLTGSQTVFSRPS